MRSVAIGESDTRYGSALAGLLDDDPGVRCVGVAITVAALVALVDETRPDVIAVDIRLPRGGAAALAEGLSIIGIDRPIVALAAMLSPASRAAADAAGAVTLVAKSDGEALLAAITTARPA